MEKSVRCGFLLARLSPSQCQPTALGSADLACPTRSLPAHCCKEAQHRANCPIEKSPALALECRGFFCSALMGGMPESHFRFPQQLPQKVENSPLYGLLPGAGGLLTDPLVSGALLQGGAAPGKLPHPKIPGTHSGMPGIFSIYSCCTGVTSARRSHVLPL